MSFYVAVPARLESTRLPGKVLRELAGRPMIAHVVSAARESGAAGVFVATDAAAVAAAGETAGATPVVTRSDHACGTDRISEVAQILGWPDETIVVNVQADEPLMPPALIDQVAAALTTDPVAAIATACCPIEDTAEFDDPNVVKVVATPSGRALYFSRAPIPFRRGDSTLRDGLDQARRHLGIYGYRVGALRRFAAAPAGTLERYESLEQLRAFELDLPIAVVDAVDIPGPGVDTEADLIAVAARMKHRQ